MIHSKAVGLERTGKRLRLHERSESHKYALQRTIGVLLRRWQGVSVPEGLATYEAIKTPIVQAHDMNEILRIFPRKIYGRVMCAALLTVRTFQTLQTCLYCLYIRYCFVLKSLFSADLQNRLKRSGNFKTFCFLWFFLILWDSVCNSKHTLY